MFQEDVWFIFPLLPLFVLFLISGLAETNRSPFDLPEAEGELVSGYNVEYSAVSFALFFIGEYANIILFCNFVVIFFLGGWNDSAFTAIFWIYFVPDDVDFEFLQFKASVLVTFKMLAVLFFFIGVRATLPRYRYDQLMYLGWKVFLPMSLGWIIFTSGFLYGLDGLFTRF